MPLSAPMVHERLRRAARRFRWSRSARHAISGTAVALAVLFVFLLSDAQFHFGPGGRWTGFVLVLAPLLAGLGAAARATLRPVSEASMARRIETACGGAQNVLISAVQFDCELAPNSALRTALFAEMRDPFPKVNWSEVFNLKLLQRLACGLAAVVAILALCALLRPMSFANSAVRILLPASNVAPLTRTQIEAITPGDTRVIHGCDLLITAKLAGEIPKAAWIYYREQGTGSWQKALMDHDIGATSFSYQWKQLREPLEYTIEAGDAASPTYHIAVRPKTAIHDRMAEVTLPEYAQRAVGKAQSTSVLKDFAVLQGVLPGSHVAVTLNFNNPISQLTARAENNKAFKAERLGEKQWFISGTVTDSTIVQLDYTDTDGLADAETLKIATKADDPPQITVSQPAEGKEILASRDAVLTIRFRATDNFALGGVSLYRSTDDKQDAELIQDWKNATNQKSFDAEIRVPLAKYAKEDHVTFSVMAKDQNNVTGPGITWSRPLVVTIQAAEELQQKSEEAGEKAQSGLDSLIKLQKANLDATTAAEQNPAADAATLRQLLNRQAVIADQGRALTASTESLAPNTRADLQALCAHEMPAAVVSLRNAVAAATPAARHDPLTQAIKLESAILARLRGASKSLETEKARGKVRDLIAAVEDLLRKQRDLLHETPAATAKTSATLSDRQDALSADSARVRKQLDANVQNASMGDDDLRARLAKASAMFGEARIYEQMLAAAEKIQTNAFPAAVGIQKELVAALAKIADLLNQWQIANAKREADALKKVAQEMAQKLGKLAELQREIVEKSKELPRKSEMKPEDLATAKELKEAKDLMAEVLEQMLTDAHIFPDLKPSNELRSELTQVYEDVIQTDKDLAAAGKLEGHEVAVQKEDGILKGIENAKKIDEDIEMWLPTANDTIKWQLENFDKTEMPEIPNLPLPDAFSDLVGDLLQEQKGLAEQAQDAASNQLMAENAANGWQVTDGPQGGFGAQGKSGNTRPEKNEQSGRSSGGREGESNGEMVGDTAGNLEGTTPDARRTSDPMQQGHIKDDGKIGETRATGGGKAGGFADRNGMDGNAPLRATNAPKMGMNDALAVQQALLAEKTSKMNAQASLLYLKSAGLSDVARLMDQSQTALKEGRMQDFRSLHQKIVAHLNEVRGGALSENVLTLTTGNSPGTQDKQLLGGDEGQAPAAYKQALTDYYRSLLEEK